jgi:flagellar basal-body rod modification protein FlgD
MTTTPIGSTANKSATATTAAGPKTLQANDFINLLITQLKNQDPTQPMSNSELLQQVSEIGQLQSQNQLQTSLQGLVMQNQISSASNLIGKHVTGNDASSNPADGIVTSISVANNSVNLNLDSGQTLPIANVTQITMVNPVTGAASVTSTAPATPAAAAASAVASALFPPGTVVTPNGPSKSN